MFDLDSWLQIAEIQLPVVFISCPEVWPDTYLLSMLKVSCVWTMKGSICCVICQVLRCELAVAFLTHQSTVLILLVLQQR